MTLIYLGTGWLLGVFLASILTIPWSAWCVFAIPPVIAAVLERSYRPRWRLYLAFSFVFLGAARLSLLSAYDDPNHLSKWNDKGWYVFRGYVADEPDHRLELVKLTVNVEQVQVDTGEWVTVQGKALLNAQYPIISQHDYSYGDVLQFEGRMETPPEWDNFSYKDYLERKGISSYMRQPRIVTLGIREGSTILHSLFQIKRNAEESLEQIYPDPEGSLLNGILLGNDNSISEPLWNSFNITGASHVIAISGYNISIIIALLYSWIRRIAPRNAAGTVTLAGIAAYAILVGGDATVVRAALMGGLIVVADMIGRSTFAPTSLFASAMVITAINPLLTWDVGFQLSFAATFGLMVLSAPLQRTVVKLIPRLNNDGRRAWLWRMLVDLIVVTCAAQLFTVPLVAYYFGRVSLVSLLTNLLIMPVQPILMISGMIAMIGGLIWKPLGMLIAWVSYPFPWWTIQSVEWTARIPWASIPVAPSIWTVITGLGLLGAVSLALHRWSNSIIRFISKGWLALACTALATISTITVIHAMSREPDGKLHVEVLNISGSPALWVQTPSGKQILIDGERDSQQLLVAVGRRMAFWDRNIDLIILTESNKTRMPSEIGNRYKVGAIVAPYTPKTGYSTLVELADQNGIQLISPEDGSSINVDDGVEITIRDVNSDKKPADRDSPLLLQILYGSTSILYASNLDKDLQVEITESSWMRQYDVLIAPGGIRDDPISSSFLTPASLDAAILIINEYDRDLSPIIMQRLEENKVSIFTVSDTGSGIDLISDGTKHQIAETH
ncbi:MAG: ComEC/Rec2 family competence protein [Chloroflexota bacterium]